MKKKKIPSLTKYVVFSIVMIILFTIVAIYYQFVSDDELSSTLITCYYGCFGGEILSCCLLKIFKLKGGNNNDSEQ